MRQKYLEKNISLGLRQKVIHDIRLKKENYWWSEIKGRELLMI